MPDKPIPPDDRIPSNPPQDAPPAPEPTFTLVKVKTIQKPPLEEELVEPAGGSGCSCNAVCQCVPVQQCGCDSVCTCDTVQSCLSYQCPHSGCVFIHCYCNVVYF